MSRGPIPDKPLIRPRVPEVLPLVRAYYAKPGNDMGGSLHSVLDDANLHDKDIRWCREEADRNADHDGIALADLMLELTGTQRRKLLSLHHDAGMYA